MAETANPAADLEIRVIPVTPLQQNTSLLWSRRTKEGVFVDPGAATTASWPTGCWRRARSR